MDFFEEPRKFCGLNMAQRVTRLRLNTTKLVQIELIKQGLIGVHHGAVRENANHLLRLRIRLLPAAAKRLVQARKIRTQALSRLRLFLLCLQV
jgi:hypothetical protein